MPIKHRCDNLNEDQAYRLVIESRRPVWTDLEHRPGWSDSTNASLLTPHYIALEAFQPLTYLTAILIGHKKRSIKVLTMSARDNYTFANQSTIPNFLRDRIGQYFRSWDNVKNDDGDHYLSLVSESSMMLLD